MKQSTATRILTSTFLTIFITVFNLNALNEESLPDSVINIDYTYYYCLSDPEKAQRILDELRRRKTDEEWKLNWCQGDLYYNTGKYRLALHFFELVSDNEEVRNNPNLYVGLLSTMMECYRMNNDLQRTMQTALEVVELAESLGNELETGRAFMFMGKVSFRQKNERLAEEYFASAEKYLVNSEDAEYLYHFYLTVANLMNEFGRYDKAYGYVLKAEESLSQMETQSVPMPEGQIFYERGRLYALASEILAQSGREKEAADYYGRFMASPSSKDSRAKIYIVPYLLVIKDYKTAINISEERIGILRAETDTLGTDMSAVLSYLTEAYEMSGATGKALSASKQAVKLSENLRRKDNENSALELATIYNVHEKEAKLIEQHNALRRRNMLLVGLCIIVAFAIGTMVLVVRSMRHTKKKNIAMVSRIREMQQYRKQLEELQRQTIKEAEQQGNRLNTGKHHEAELFARIDQRIRGEKLYLNPGLTREDAIKLLCIGRNDLIRVLNDYAEMNFSDYINGLRLEEALRLLDDSPAMALEKVALNSGFGSTRSFYRRFKDKYNMSASEYRKLAGGGNAP